VSCQLVLGVQSCQFQVWDDSYTTSIPGHLYDHYKNRQQRTKSHSEYWGYSRILRLLRSTRTSYNCSLLHFLGTPQPCKQYESAYMWGQVFLLVDYQQRPRESRVCRHGPVTEPMSVQVRRGSRTEGLKYEEAQVRRGSSCLSNPGSHTSSTHVRSL
jgi:hypothetical protein